MCALTLYKNKVQKYNSVLKTRNEGGGGGVLTSVSKRILAINVSKESTKQTKRRRIR